MARQLWGAFRPPVSWYPGHMAKASRQVKERVSRCDIVLEVRDARIPLSSVNPEFDAMLNNKRRLVVFNKVDLAEPRATDLVAAQCRDAGIEAMFISATGKVLHRYSQAKPCSSSSGNPSSSANSRKGHGSGGVTPLIERLQLEAAGKFKTTGCLAMITGVPNVGKSTIINALAKAAKTNASTGHRSGAGSKRKSKASSKLGSDEYRPAGSGTTKHLARVGDRPGVTRAVASILVSAAPSLVRVLDTPGIMLPKVSGPEQGLKLALTGAIRDEVVGEETLVAYLLHILHERRDAMIAAQELKIATVTEGKAKLPKMPKDPLQDLPQRLLKKSEAAGHDRGTSAVNNESKGSQDEGSAADKLTVKREGVKVAGKEQVETRNGAKDDSNSSGLGEEAASRNAVAGTHRSAQSHRDWSVHEVVDLVEAASGASGKPEPERTRMACRFVLARFRAGYLGPITLDDVGQFSLQEKTSQQQPIREHAGSDASDVIAASESASPVPLAVDTYEDTEKFETKEKVLAYNPNDIFG